VAAGEEVYHRMRLLGTRCIIVAAGDEMYHRSGC
jgi:hypothetical protein